VLVLVVVGLAMRKAIDDEHDDDNDNGKTGDAGVSSSSSSSILGSWSAKKKRKSSTSTIGEGSRTALPAIVAQVVIKQIVPGRFMDLA
jgi:hypothetical protein